MGGEWEKSGKKEKSNNIGKMKQYSRGEQKMGTRREDQILVLTKLIEKEAFKPLIK